MVLLFKYEAGRGAVLTLRTLVVSELLPMRKSYHYSGMNKEGNRDDLHCF